MLLFVTHCYRVAHSFRLHVTRFDSAMMCLPGYVVFPFVADRVGGRFAPAENNATKLAACCKRASRRVLRRTEDSVPVHGS